MEIKLKNHPKFKTLTAKQVAGLIGTIAKTDGFQYKATYLGEFGKPEGEEKS